MDTSSKVIVVISVLLARFCAQCQDQLCNDRLIKSLPDDHLTASSSKSGSSLLSPPSQARLNKTEQVLNNGTKLAGAWSPASDRAGEYVQAMFGEMTMISGLLTQGRNQGYDHVTLFKLEYTEDGTTWQTVNNDVGVEQIFMGNQDGDTIQENFLTCPIFARGIRIIPLEWDKHIALRFDVTGCFVDNSIIVITTPAAATLITTTASTAAILTTVTTPTILTTLQATNATTSLPFFPGIITPFGPTKTGTSLLTTPTKPLSTTNPASTVNLLTLIHWFMTHINNNTTPTTPVTTPTTTTVTTPTTPLTTLTTTPDVFLPGIPNPFGTTKSNGGLPPIIG